MDNIYVFLPLWEGKQIKHCLKYLVNFLKEKNNILTSDYTINEYSLALFLNKNANFKINLLKNFFKKKKNRFFKNFNC